MSAEQPESVAGSDPVPLRASDADRDSTIAVLREGLASGRLEPDEYEERMAAALRARTHQDLAPLVRDLPAGPGAITRRPPSAGTTWSGPMQAVFGGIQRRGRWGMPAHVPVKVAFGGAELDLRQADLAAARVELEVKAVFGGVSVTVPPEMRVVVDVKAVFGGATEPKAPPSTDDGPVLVITGKVVFGGVDVKRELRES